MKKFTKRILGLVFALVMVCAMFPMNAFAENWQPTDTISIKVRVFDASTGNVYNVGTDSITKGDQNIQSDPYRIPELSKFTSNSYGTVTKVVGNWYFPAGDQQVGATVNWSCNVSSVTMTYWVTNWSTGSGSGSGSDGNGSENQGSGKYSMNCTIVYHSNYPSGTNYTQTYSYTIYATYNIANTGRNVDLKTPSGVGFTVPDGYKGASTPWNTKADGSGSGANNTYMCKNNETVHLYAQWVKDTTGGTPVTEVTVTYMDGTKVYDTQKVFSGDAVTVINDTDSKEGYTFKGWSDSETANTVQYLPGDEIIVTGDKTLYAVWEKNSDPQPEQYTITYKNGEEIVGTQTVNAGESANAMEAPEAQNGKEFVHWVDEEGNTYVPGVAIIPTGNMILTAVWKDKGGDTPDPNEKTNEPGMDKKVNNGDSATVKPGETVTYTLTSNVPDYLGNYIPAENADEPSLLSDEVITRGSYELIFHDKMDAGLIFNNDVEVTVNGKTLDTSLYTLETTCADGCTFEVTMDLVKIYQAGSYFTMDEIQDAPEIIVTYTAKLDENAEPGSYKNQAWVGFEGDKESEKPTPEVKTYGIKVFKYDQANNEAPLAGAEFELKDSDGKVIATLTSAEDGYAIYKGLPAGAYTLTETKAPDGYVKSDTPITITIPDDADAAYYANVKFANSPIPHTGGEGTRKYTIFGMAILGFAALYFVVTRRKKTEK